MYRSFDFGYSKPFSCAWWTMDNNGILYRILELYGCTGQPNVGVKWTVPEIASKIHEIETTHRWFMGKKILGVADPSIWDVSRGESVADVLAKSQVFFDKGDNKRIPGKMQLHYRLAFSEEGYPMMYVFGKGKDGHELCPAFIRTIPELTYSETHPEDVDTSLEDHPYDDARYLCQLNPIPPRKPVKRDSKPYNPLETNTRYQNYEFYNIRPY
jgi:hypothetical protein